MYLRALTNKMVPDTDSLSINELPKVATSQNNVEYSLYYSKYYQGCIDRSFCLLKYAPMNTFSDSPDGMLILDGYVMAVIKNRNSFYLFDSHARQHVI